MVSTAEYILFDAVRSRQPSLSWNAGWTDAQREDKRKDLQFVLDATVCSQDGTIFYYQGLHDIASVLLLTMGDKAAFETLTHLSLCQLRDCTRCT